MNTSIFILVLFFSIIPSTISTGFLNLRLTSDMDCLLHLEHGDYAQTVRLLAYETKLVDVPIQSNQLKTSIDFQFLHHFSGASLYPWTNSLEFNLDNNGLIESKVIDTKTVILSVQSMLLCDQGFFGPSCDRRSKIVQTVTSTVTKQSMSLDKWKSAEISNEIIIYFSLALFVVILIIAIGILFCYRPSEPRKYMEETLPFEYPQLDEADHPVSPSCRSIPATPTLQSRV
ncbi:CBN-SDZ-1 protein [Caenorhabditis brenneri]|uniref:CBN-SDZ-1 protein n=1 Tax=Caenorhabditis brenneri TaxID=135651 RepID=G0NB61_CAEBE|nr:CBN-SDZ-1 protein [Caenorhabditis brenneri]